MHAGKLSPVLLLIAAALCASAGARETFRCNAWIIEAGMALPEVLGKCGEPDFRDAGPVPVRARSMLGGTYVIGTTTFEQWVYERRPGQFPVHLTFDQGRLRSIEFLSRR